MRNLLKRLLLWILKEEFEDIDYRLNECVECDTVIQDEILDHAFKHPELHQAYGVHPIE